mmetsp:Transcript_25446/g.32073  ORF Transcript_25446/g.32073 Transcript_25446/m.32073 type:complete len:87 (-) Transcript_25446:42-302(-)
MATKNSFSKGSKDINEGYVDQTLAMVCYNSSGQSTSHFLPVIDIEMSAIRTKKSPETWTRSRVSVKCDKLAVPEFHFHDMDQITVK